jgi:multidrug efflux pump subunit AcrA (membrane-fusion protein)
VSAQPVRLGAQDGMYIEILEGLKEGETVVY